MEIKINSTPTIMKINFLDGVTFPILKTLDRLDSLDRSDRFFFFIIFFKLQTSKMQIFVNQCE